MKRFILFILLSFNVSADVDCLDALKQYFDKDIDKTTQNKLLEIQAKLTLNRLAWANLKSSKETHTLEIEKNILHLLKIKHDQTDPAFKQAVEYFEKAPLSRNALAEIAPHFSKLMNQNMTEQSDQLYLINASDIKLLEIMREFETKKSNGEYDVRHFNGRILNLASLVNSSHSKLSVDNSTLIENNLVLVQSEIIQAQNQLDQLLDQFPIPKDCLEITLLDGCKLQEDNELKLSDLYHNISSIKEFIDQNLLASISKTNHEKEIMDKLGFAKLWQKVSFNENHQLTQPELIKRDLNLNFRAIKLERLPLLPAKPIIIKSAHNARTQGVSVDQDNELAESIPVVSLTPEPTLKLQLKRENIPTSVIRSNPSNSWGIGMMYYITYPKYYKIEGMDNIYLIENDSDLTSSNVASALRGSHVMVRIDENPDGTKQYNWIHQQINSHTREHEIVNHKNMEQTLCSFDPNCQNLAERTKLIPEALTKSSGEDYLVGLEQRFDELLHNIKLEKSFKENLSIPRELVRNKSLGQIDEAYLHYLDQILPPHLKSTQGMYDEWQKINNSDLSQEEKTRLQNKIVDMRAAIINLRGYIEKYSHQEKNLAATKACQKPEIFQQNQVYCHDVIKLSHYHAQYRQQLIPIVKGATDYPFPD